MLHDHALVSAHIGLLVHLHRSNMVIVRVYHWHQRFGHRFSAVPYEDKTAHSAEQLKPDNVFVRTVTGGDFPYHSPSKNLVAPQLLEALNRVIPE